MTNDELNDMLRIAGLLLNGVDTDALRKECASHIESLVREVKKLREENVAMRKWFEDIVQAVDRYQSAMYPGP